MHIVHRARWCWARAGVCLLANGDAQAFPGVPHCGVDVVQAIHRGLGLWGAMVPQGLVVRLLVPGPTSQARSASFDGFYLLHALPASGQNQGSSRSPHCLCPHEVVTGGFSCPGNGERGCLQHSNTSWSQAPAIQVTSTLHER